MENNTLDTAKRRTLKLLTGTTMGLLAGLPAIAKSNSQFPLSDTMGEHLDCTLISRADLVRAYMLLHNRTENDIIAARFNEQLIRFDDTTFNLADAYVEPVVIPSNDRVMVRLNVEAAMQNLSVSTQIIDLDDRTRFLSQGTRVVEMPVLMHNGAGSVVGLPPA